jgi:hypothetical protein
MVWGRLPARSSPANRRPAGPQGSSFKRLAGVGRLLEGFPSKDGDLEPLAYRCSFPPFLRMSASQAQFHAPATSRRSKRQAFGSNRRVPTTTTSSPNAPSMRAAPMASRASPWLQSRRSRTGATHWRRRSTGWKACLRSYCAKGWDVVEIGDNPRKRCALGSCPTSYGSWLTRCCAPSASTACLE